MVKWADFLISGVRYDSDHSFIKELRSHEDNENSMGSSFIEQKHQVISKIKSSKTYVTIYKKDGKWNKGEDVRVIKVNGKEFIRTDGNSIEADNLGHLPEF